MTDCPTKNFLKLEPVMSVCSSFSFLCVCLWRFGSGTSSLKSCVVKEDLLLLIFLEKDVLPGLGDENQTSAKSSIWAGVISQLNGSPS